MSSFELADCPFPPAGFVKALEIEFPHFLEHIKGLPRGVTLSGKGKFLALGEPRAFIGRVAVGEGYVEFQLGCSFLLDGDDGGFRYHRPPEVQLFVGNRYQ